MATMAGVDRTGPLRVSPSSTTAGDFDRLSVSWAASPPTPVPTSALQAASTRCCRSKIASDVSSGRDNFAIRNRMRSCKFRGFILRRSVAAASRRMEPCSPDRSLQLLRPSFRQRGKRSRRFLIGFFCAPIVSGDSRRNYCEPASRSSKPPWPIRLRSLFLSPGIFLQTASGTAAIDRRQPSSSRLIAKPRCCSSVTTAPTGTGAKGFFPTRNATEVNSENGRGALRRPIEVARWIAHLAN